MNTNLFNKVLFKFDFPENLPDLDNLAFDVHYVKNFISSEIFPSKAPPLPPIPSEFSVPDVHDMEVKSVKNEPLEVLQIPVETMNDRPNISTFVEVEVEDELVSKDLESETVINNDMIGIGDGSNTINGQDLEITKNSLRPVSERVLKEVTEVLPNGIAFNHGLISRILKERRQRIENDFF